MVVASTTEGSPAARQAQPQDEQATVERAKRSAATTPRDGLVWRVPIPRVAGAGADGSFGGVDAKKPQFESEDAEAAWPGQPEYHPPRTPPPSIAPPPVASSFSVAPQYDPKAPTRPRARRNTSVPSPPLLFGLDRMLVWGLVLGGLFVAVIVVIVHQLALTAARRPQDAVMERDRETLANENRQPGNQQVEPLVVAHEPSELARTAATGEAEPTAVHARGSANGPERGSFHSGSVDAGVLPNSAVTRDSTDVEPVQAGEKVTPAGIGGGKATPSSSPRPSRAGALPRKSWIE
jgi:hypothetical protein